MLRHLFFKIQFHASHGVVYLSSLSILETYHMYTVCLTEGMHTCILFPQLILTCILFPRLILFFLTINAEFQNEKIKISNAVSQI